MISKIYKYMSTYADIHEIPQNTIQIRISVLELVSVDALGFVLSPKGVCALLCKHAQNRIRDFKAPVFLLFRGVSLC